MYVQASQCPSTVPTKANGLSGCGCGGSCGAKTAGLGVYMSVCKPVPTSSLTSTNRGLGLYLPVNNPVPTSSLVDTNQGLGQVEHDLYGRNSQLYGKAGLGLFDSMDFTTWGAGEWGLVAVGAYLLMSLAGDTSRGAKRVKKFSRKRSYSAAKKRKLLEEASSL